MEGEQMGFKSGMKDWGRDGWWEWRQGLWWGC